MTDTSRSEQSKRVARGRDDETTITPAIRHVGRTLESESMDNDTEGEDLTPEAQIAKVGAPPDTTMGRGATDLSADVSSTDDGAMTEVVHAAAGLARPGDTVLLAPAAASYDMFTSYAARGDLFAAAAHALGPDVA